MKSYTKKIEYLSHYFYKMNRNEVIQECELRNLLQAVRYESN